MATPKFNLIEWLAAQATPWVTYVSNLFKIDQLMQISVKNVALTAPPGSESEGDAYIVAGPATGDWATHENELAVFQNAAYIFIPLVSGSVIWNEDDKRYYQWDGTTVKKKSREILDADRTYYVATTGANTNDGLSVSNEFLTIQKAVDVIVNNLDLGGFTVTIDVGNGTYAENIVLGVLFNGSVIIDGDTTTPANVIVSATGSDICIDCARHVINWTVQGIKTSGTGRGIRSLGYLILDAIDFGNTGSWQQNVETQGVISWAGDYTISAGAAIHMSIAHSGIGILLSQTVTLTGTPNFSTAFANVVYFGKLRITGMTFTGSATGKRYVAENQGGIATNGGGATYLPGDVAGTTATGGQYV